MTRTLERRWLALVLLTVTQFMVVLDVAIVNVALPSIQQRSTSRSRTCSGSRAPTRSPSAASCCSAAGRPTCSAAGGCSWPAWSLFAAASLAAGLAPTDDAR